MTASKDNPIYTVYVVAGSTKYNITSAVTSIDISDEEKQVAKAADISLMNVKTGSKWLSDLIGPRDRVYIHANDGSKNEEVFRGFVWTYGAGWGMTDRDLKMKCYDQLIYFQESEVSAYFSPGKSTKAVIQKLCGDWGVSLNYKYESITHSKLALRGYLTDVILEDLLELVKDRTGKKYVMLSEKDVVQIKQIGQNSTVYQIVEGKNAIKVSYESTMDGMITKVIILGKADEDDREPVEATVSGNTSKYGTLQKLIDRDENTTLADAKKEAQTILDENGKPFETFSLEAPDIPWIRKGDKIYIQAGTIKGNYIALSIDRSISNSGAKMKLDLEKA